MNTRQNQSVKLDAKKNCAAPVETAPGTMTTDNEKTADVPLEPKAQATAVANAGGKVAHVVATVDLELSHQDVDLKDAGGLDENTPRVLVLPEASVDLSVPATSESGIPAASNSETSTTKVSALYRSVVCA